MPQGWLDRAGVVIVGETGTEVSNNHDVMSLEVGGTTSAVPLDFRLLFLFVFLFGVLPTVYACRVSLASTL